MGAIKKAHTDIDIDVKDRDEVLALMDHVPASERITEDGIVPHKVGVYFDDIPFDPETGLASITYKTAEDLGYQKVDFLNVHVYDQVKDRTHLRELMARPVRWELFQVPEIVGELFQLGNQISVVLTWAPTNVHQVAMLIAMIRPAKRHLVGCNSWAEIEADIWNYKNTNGKAYFKKAHAMAYAHAIIVQLNALVESLENELAQQDH